MARFQIHRSGQETAAAVAEPDRAVIIDLASVHPARSTSQLVRGGCAGRRMRGTDKEEQELLRRSEWHLTHGISNPDLGRLLLAMMRDMSQAS